MRSMGYEGKSKVLEIEFQSGTVYQYLDVPESVYEELEKANSKGRYFNRAIRDEYDSVRLGKVRRAGRG